MSELGRQVRLGLVLVPVGLALQLAAMLLLARHLGPELWGVFTVFLATVQVAQFVTEMGAGTVVTKLVAEGRRPAGEYIALSLPPILISAFVVAAGVAIGMCFAYPIDLVGPAALLLGVNVLLFGTSMVLSCAVRGLGRVNQWQLGFFGQKVVLVAATVAVVLAGGGITAGMGTWTIANVVTLLYFVRCLYPEHWRFQLRWERDGTRELFRQSLPVGAISVLNQLAMQMDTFLLAAFVGRIDLGLYAVSQRLMNPARTVLNGTIVTPTFPELCRLAMGRDPEFRVLLSRLLRINWLAGLAMSIAAFVVAPWALPLVLGESFAESVRVLQITIWALALSFVGLQLRFAFVAAGMQARFLQLSLIAVLSKAGVMTAAIVGWGMWGACVGTVLSEALATVIAWVELRRRGSRLEIRSLSPMTLGAAAVVLIAWWLGPKNALVPIVGAIYCLGSLIVFLRLIRGMRSGGESAATAMGEGATTRK